MTTPSSPPAKTVIPQPDRPRRWLRRALVAGAILLAVYAMLVFGAGAYLGAALKTYAGNSSLDFADYVPDPLPEERVNATDFIEAAALIVEGQESVYLPRDNVQPHPGIMALRERMNARHLDRSPATDEDLRKAREVVKELELALAVLDEGLSTAEGARFKTNWDAVPLEILIPNLLVRLRFSNLLRARAEVALADGRPDAAWDDAVAIFHLAHWTGQSAPTLINALVARAVAVQGSLLTQALLAATPPDAETMERIVAAARRAGPDELFANAFAGERAAVVTTLRDPRLENQVLAELDFAEENPEWSFPQRALLGWRPWHQLNAAAYLAWATPAFKLCQSLAYQQEDPQAKMDYLRPPAWAEIAQRVTFDCLDAGYKRDNWLATLDFLEIAQHLEAVRRESGEYPQSLDALPGGNGWIDPFSGTAYHYRRDGEGYLLYSISANRQDDGGALPPKRASASSPDTDQGDHVFWVRPPEAEQ